MPEANEEDIRPDSLVELASQQENPGYANSGITGPSNMGAVGDTGLLIPKPRKKDLNLERGVTFSYPFSTQYHDLWELWRTEKVTVKQLEVMRRTDGHARALYSMLTMPIRACLKTASIAPVAGIEGGTDEANFIDMMLNLPPAAGGMVVPMNQFIAQMLLGTFHGFSAFELVYWVPKKGPLANKVTLKKASWRPPDTIHFLTNDQAEFAGWRQRCLRGSTLISQLDGTEISVLDMVKKHEAGEQQWVYSSTLDGHVVPGKVSYAAKTSDSEPVLEVTLDNGEKVVCTHTHPWLLRSGEYKRADALQPGDSLMPLYRKKQKLNAYSGQEYEWVSHPAGSWEPTHRMVSRELGFGVRGGEIIHHGFEGLGHLNNDPRNLTRLTRDEHKVLHERLGAEGQKALRKWQSEASPEKLSKLATQAAYKRWSNPDYRQLRSEQFKAQREQWIADGIDLENTRRHDITFEVLDSVAREMAASGSKLTAVSLAQELSCSKDVILARMRDAGFPDWKTYKWTLVERDRDWAKKSGAPVNHKVAAIRFLDEPEAVYDIEVEDYHNFALSAGVFVHNTFQHGRYIDVLLPNETAIVYTCRAEEAPFYGVSMFETAFWHYDKKVKLYYLAHLAAQKGAIGTRIGHMPPNPNSADVTHFLEQLGKLGTQQFMAMPIDWDVDVVQEAGKFDYISFIEHHNHMMSESVMAGFMDGNATGGNTPQVDFSTQDDTLLIQMLETIMDDVASVINNQLIPRFIDWNFGTGLYPTFKWGPFTDEQKDAIRLAFNQLSMAPTINMEPELWQALQLKWAEDLGINTDTDILQSRWDVQNEQQQDLAALNYKTQLVEAKNALDMAVNPPPPEPVAGPLGAPTAAPKAAPAKKTAAKTVAPVKTAPAKTATPAKATPAKTAAKVTEATTSAATHRAPSKQNAGNSNPTQGPKQLSPKSAAQKDEDRQSERKRGH